MVAVTLKIAHLVPADGYATRLCPNLSHKAYRQCKGTLCHISMTKIVLVFTTEKVKRKIALARLQHAERPPWP